MSRFPHHTLRFIGVALIIFVGLGLWYNGTVMLTKFPADPSTPYFSHAFYIMLAICIACYLTLLFIGLQFIRLKSSLLRLFIGVMIFEVVYFFAVGFLWLSPGLGSSVATASGVANGGLMFQFLTLFPLWGPFLASWATRRIEAGPEESGEIIFPAEQIARTSDWAWAVVNFLVMLFLTFMLLGLIGSHLSPQTLLLGYLPVIAVLLSATNALWSVRLKRKRRRQAIQRRHDERLRAGLCPRCEYNLTGLPEARCPECGVEFDGRYLPH
ncbi:MAG: hypothetical protein ACYTF1_17225 [Planctomycetota bacterium]|jgi:hypothetical protein